ncbi:MAG: hypothetical protein OXP68_05985 [Anaerolineaceae bacterium]|nr:hypothetical protein [Anaerolineaceae bacterium]MDE0327512.1 hypothetical protein [Anaerolineaceae bacterium]
MEVPGIVKSGLILWLAGALLLTASPAAAQNPPVAACGLPAGGAISASVTYTLSASCTQTSMLSTTAADIEVTINGGGHSITSSGDVLFSVGSGVLTLNDVTLNGGGLEFSQLVQAARLDATRASFINLGRGTALAAAQMNLNNV